LRIERSYSSLTDAAYLFWSLSCWAYCVNTNWRHSVILYLTGSLFSLSIKRKRKTKRDQFNQQCERYWLKHCHFLYWVLLTNLEARYDYVWMYICSCLMLIFFLTRIVILSKLRMSMFPMYFIRNNQSEEKILLSLSHFSHDKIIWIMINLHWNQRTMMSIT
jgi:hypothetical protein